MLIPLGTESPLERSPLVTPFLLLLHLSLYLTTHPALFGDFGQELFDQLALVPLEVTTALPWQWQGLKSYATLLTSGFLHGGAGHLIGNMLFLWAFAPRIEMLLGTRRFLAFYAMALCSTSLCYVMLDPNAAIPCVGASGAIAAVMGAYLIKFRHLRVRTLAWWGMRGRMCLAPVLVMVVLYCLMNLAMDWETANIGRRSDVAISALLLGFAIGILAVGLLTGFRLSPQHKKRMASTTTTRPKPTLLGLQS